MNKTIAKFILFSLSHFLLRSNVCQKHPVLFVATFRPESADEKLWHLTERKKVPLLNLSRLKQESISFIVQDMLALKDPPHFFLIALPEKSSGQPPSHLQP